MTDIKFEILERLYLESEKTHISESELLNPFVSKKNNDVNSAKHALNQMIEQNYVIRSAPGEYRVTVKGIDIYEAEHAARLKEQTAKELRQIQDEKNETNRKKQLNHDWFVALFSMIGGAVSGLASSLIFWLITGNGLS